MMKKIEKAQKKKITIAVVCCVLLAMIFSANLKNLLAFATNLLNEVVGTEAATERTMVVMKTDDAVQMEDYIAFGVYAPSTAIYTIEVTAENGSVRVNTGEAIAVNEKDISVTLTEGTNVLYFINCDNPSIQWDSDACALEPVNKVTMFLAGDVDQSEERTVADLVRIKREAALSGNGEIKRTELADIDGNGNVTGEDVSLLRTLMVGNPGYEVTEQRAVIVDAYIEKTETLYDTLAEAVTAASEISVSTSEPVTVTVLNPTDVKLTGQVSIEGGAQIILQDDGAYDDESGHNGWSRTITRGSEKTFKMFTVADATLTLTGSDTSDEHSSLILDGGGIANAKNHIVDVGWTPSTAKSGTLTMNAGVKLTNNINNGSNSGGGALAIKYTFNMNGGIISGNINAGNSGAINLGTSGTTMNMTGGVITENETMTDIYSAGGVNISKGATLIMTGGEIYANIAPDSVGCNSVRKAHQNSTLKMGGSAYIDRVCFDDTSVDTHCMELTSKLTTDKEISLFFTQPLCYANAVVKRDRSCAENDALFALSERMLPCQLERDESNANLCLRSDITGMGTVTAIRKVYSGASDLSALFKTIDDTWVVQGVCSDDEYLYMAIAQTPSAGCKILRVELGTWKNPVLSATLPTDHSNEMTYNPDTDRIYITHCISEGTGSTTKSEGPYAISVVNPDTLTLDSTVGKNGIIQLETDTAYTGKTGIYALAYNASQKYYVAGATGFRFGFLKDDNGTITEYAMPKTGLSGFIGYTGHIKQGVYASDSTIYANTWYDITNVANEEQNFITMYDWSGNYNGTKLVVNSDGTPFVQEIESMFEYDGAMYIACFPTNHTGVEIYQLGNVGTATSTIDVIDDVTGNPVDGVYTNLSDAITKANTLESATIVLKDDVTIGETQVIQGNITIKDDGTQRTLQRGTGCTAEMFNVAGGAKLTFTSSSMDDKNPKFVIDGNKDGVTTTGTSPVVRMNKTDGILNITSGVIVQNNKSTNAGAVIYAGANNKGASGGGLATINITGGLFTGNEITHTAQWVFGGCIYIESGCKLNISNAIFNNNAMTTSHASGRTYGGVICVRTGAGQPNDGASVILENCKFEKTNITQKTSESDNGGGVLYIGGEKSNSVQITNCEFTDNKTGGCGGAIYMLNTTNALELSGCSFHGNKDKNGANDIYMVAATKVNVSGNTQANINCAGTEQIHIKESLGTDSVIQVNVSATTVGDTVVTFASEAIMNDCKEKGYLILPNESYALNYETTSDSKYVAKLANAVAAIGERRYASLADAIEAANALESATIVLKADTTVNATQTITGNITITDDGTAKTITRGTECTVRVFDIQESASLTLAGTITVDGNKTNVTATESMLVNAGTFNLGANASLINAGNASDSTTMGGALYNAGTTTLAGTFDSNEAYKGGAVYTTEGATLNITGGTFGTEGNGNTSGYRAGAVYVQNSTSVIISNATFTNNSSYRNNGSSAGVLYIETCANVKIDRCTFINNSATAAQSKTTYGGCVYMENATVEISNTSFSFNSAVRGGAIYMKQVTNELTLYNCDFGDNTADFGRDVFYDNKCKLILSGRIGNAQIDKRDEKIHVVGNLDITSQIEIMQISGKSGMVQVEFESAEATQIGEQCITYYDYYDNSGTIINKGLTLQFDVEKYQAIMK